MPKYYVMEKSFINGHLVESGEIVDYDGEVSSNLQLVEEDAKPVKPEAKGKGKADN